MIILESIKYIDKVIPFDTTKELRDFFDQLSTDNFTKIEEFFDGMPKLSHTVKVKNPNTGVESDIVLEGLQSFLG